MPGPGQACRHEPIVAAIEAGDTEAAVQAVRHHHEAMLEHLHRSRPETAADG
ncbi:hypothetical protein ACFXJ5_33825 [Streptomyces sp. NPDC059373]